MALHLHRADRTDLLAAAIYFVINYSLSTLSRRLEARFAYIRE